MATIVTLVLLALTVDTILAEQCFHGNEDEPWMEVCTCTKGERLEAKCRINSGSTTDPTFTWHAVRPFCDNETDRKTLGPVPGLVDITSSSSMSLVSIDRYRLFGFGTVTLYCLVNNVTYDDVSCPTDGCFTKAKVGINKRIVDPTICDIDSHVLVERRESYTMKITNGEKPYLVQIKKPSEDVLVNVSVEPFDNWDNTLNGNRQPGSDVMEVDIRLPNYKPAPNNKRPELTITFPIKSVADNERPRCAYLNNRRRWTSKKCKTTKMPNGKVQCKCKSGTIIAVLKIARHTCKENYSSCVDITAPDFRQYLKNATTFCNEIFTDPCSKVNNTVDDGAGTGGQYSISIPPPVGVTVSTEAEVTPFLEFPAPIYSGDEIKVRFSSDVLELRMVDDAEKEVTDFQQDPVELQFPVQPYNAKVEEPECCYFIENETNWSNEGCNVSFKNATYVQCICNHLTSFAILMRPVEFRLSSKDERILDILTKIGLSLSITCLTATLLTYAICRMRSLRIVIHADLAFALLAAHVLFLFLDTKDQVACRFIAISLHFFLLAAFVWMFLEGVFLFIKATPTFRWKIKMPVLLSVGWGCPAVIVIISMIFKFEGYKSDQACWLSTDYNFRWAFLAPVLVIIMANTALLVRLIFIFMSLQTNKKKDEAQKMKAGLRLVLILEPMLGIPWLFGLFYESIVFSYTFVILNTLQGVFFFVVQCLLDHEVRRKFIKLNPENTTKIMSLTTSTSGQADTKSRVKSSPSTSQSAAQSRLFVMSNKVQDRSNWKANEERIDASASESKNLRKTAMAKTWRP